MCAFLYRSHDLLRNIHKLENLAFQKIAQDLINKKGYLVAGDDLISSRATDVEVKTISNRKTGNEGPISDCVDVLFLLNIMYGMRLRTSSVTQKDNLASLNDFKFFLVAQWDNFPE